jgi:hypothetical protein
MSLLSLSCFIKENTRFRFLHTGTKESPAMLKLPWPSVCKLVFQHLLTLTLRLPESFLALFFSAIARSQTVTMTTSHSHEFEARTIESKDMCAMIMAGLLQEKKII